MARLAQAARGTGEAPRNRAGRGTAAGVGIMALLLLVGMNLRTPLLSVTPLLAVIRADLGLSYTATGLLSSLPTLLMGLGAWPSGRIAARIGGRASVGLGLALVTAGLIARGVWPGAITLYLFTALLAAGIALGQTAIPSLAREWYPQRIGLVSAIYTDGLTIGEALAAAVTAPLMRAWFGADAWPAALLIWAVPAMVTLALWLWLAPPSAVAPATGARAPEARDEAPETVATSERANAPAARARVYDVSPWVIGAIMGGGSLVYFGLNGWVAPYNAALHASSLTPLTLLAINAAQLPITIGLTPLSQRLAGKRWPFMVAGVVSLVAIGGWLLTPVAWQPLWGAAMGAAAAGVFTLAIALPALFARGAWVARLTGSSLALSYTAVFVGPFLGGALWDTFHQPWLALTPVMVGGLALASAPLLLPKSPSRRRPRPSQTLAALVEEPR